MKPEIQKAAVDLALEVGYRNVTREALASRLGKPLNWMTNHVAFFELLGYLRDNAESLGLKPGARRAGDLSGFWRALDKEMVRDAAYGLAKQGGLAAVTRPRLAEITGVALATIFNYFGGTGKLREEVVAQAVRDEHIGLISQGLALGIDAARQASDPLKERALCLLK